MERDLIQNFVHPPYKPRIKIKTQIDNRPTVRPTYQKKKKTKTVSTPTRIDHPKNKKKNPISTTETDPTKQLLDT